MSREAWVDDFISACVDEDRKVHAAKVLLLAALHVGPHIRPLKEATGIPWALVQNTSYYLREQKVWGRFEMNYPWLDPLIANEPVGDIGFILDALIGAGYVTRRWSGADKPEYSLRQLGEGILEESSGVWAIDFLNQHERTIRIPKWPNRPIDLCRVLD